MRQIAIIGQGRLGTALAAALRVAEYTVVGPLERGASVGDAGVVILCVPDSQIAIAAAAVPPGPLVAHCSGARTLAPLGGRDGFSMHPLLSVTKQTTSFTDAGCAVSATTPEALAVCLELVQSLGMRAFEVS